MRLRKHHQMLLEVLISLTLVLMCLLPLLQPHVVMIQNEKEFIREVQLDRVVNQLFANMLVDQFYGQRINWNMIAEKSNMTVDSSDVKALGYQGSYVIIHSQPQPEETALDETKAFHLLQILYTFKPVIAGGKTLQYTFDLFVQKPLPKQAPSENPTQTPTGGTSSA